MLRVIQVLHHSLGSVHVNAEAESGAQGWHEVVAREIAKRTKDIDIECWRPESSAVRMHIWGDQYGVTHRVYPSIRVRYGIELSRQLIADLRGVRNNGPILLHLHGLYNLTTYSLAFSLGGKVPIVAHSHDPLASDHGKLRRIQNPLRRYALHNIDRFFLPTEAQSHLFSEICGNRQKIRIAPLPVDLKQFHRIDKEGARRKLGWKPEALYILFVGRAEERKGLRYLIEAQRLLLLRFPSLQVMVAGAGRRQQKVSSNITFLGQVRYSELPVCYNAADVCVQPSLRESWGRAIIESLGCQTPVIATWTGCVPTLMEEGAEGLFTVPMRDSTELANTISEVLRNSDTLRRRIDRKKLEKYDSGNFVTQMLLNYKELADWYY